MATPPKNSFQKKPLSRHPAVRRPHATTGNATTTTQQDSISDQEGQLALDVYQTNRHIVIVAPIAGVTLADINVSVTEDVLTIKGARQLETEADDEDYFTQECFWGAFSRSIVLPAAVDPSQINASFKHGILKVTIPKTERSKTKVVRINTE